MIPRLRRRAALIFTLALGTILCGAVAQLPVLLGLGAAVLTALVTLYVQFFPVSIYLRRQKVDVAWWATHTDHEVAGTSVPLELTIRNHGRRTLYVRDIRPVTAAGISVNEIDEPVLAAGHQAVVTTTVQLRAFGRWCIHGCELQFRDALDLFDLRAYFPSFVEIRANPPSVPNRPRRRAAPQPRVGIDATRSRRAGQGDEIYELREYKPGDPFKAINWKASARQRKLITREMESSNNLAHAFILDIGAAMRDGPVGETLLDAAAAAIWRHANQLLTGGHRIGLLTFDSAPHWSLPLGATPRWRTAVSAMLAELPHVIDRSTNESQPGQLVELASHYLREQSGLSFRVAAPPTLDASRWTNLQIGADANFYDLGRMVAYLQDAGIPAAGTRAWRDLSAPDQEPAISALRRYCQWRCLPMPPATQSAHGARSAALAAQLERATAQRPSQITIWTSGDRLLESHDRLEKAMSACRRAGIAITAPLLPTSANSEALDDVGQAAWFVLTRLRAQQRATARNAWSALGIAAE